MEFIVENENKLIEKVWKQIGPQIRPSLVVGLIGDLGAGKTTLVSMIASMVGIKEKITSPTFNIVKTYELPKDFSGIKHICHIDLYRLEKYSKTDIAEIVESIENPETLSFIEWPEMIPDISEKISIFITLKSITENKREVTINGFEN